ncbi:ATP-dependent protease subunit HslV [candidate division KSB1 bacterium]|nr:ATP-dependent protease subunit HslV [candidate division KSB1 bacterium]
MYPETRQTFHATTILCVKKGGKVAIGGDGQVTFGDTVMKEKARKVRKLHDDTILAGFAGAAADAFTLFEKFEQTLEEFNGNLSRAAVELAKEWRMDKYLRRLEALLAVADKKTMLLISGTGDVIEPDDAIIAIGSGGPYAQAAARALIAHSKLDAVGIVKESMKIASGICIYTNDRIVIEELE